VQRQRERGYNQAELLARRLQHTTRVPLQPDALRRVRVTTSQMTLEAAQRRVNVAGAFEGQPAQVRDKRVLLIDDVCTTSATLHACATALKQAGACEVWGLTLARTP
jgi:ComF family protein